MPLMSVRKGDRWKGVGFTRPGKKVRFELRYIVRSGRLGSPVTRLLIRPVRGSRRRSRPGRSHTDT